MQYILEDKEEIRAEGTQKAEEAERGGMEIDSSDEAFYCVSIIGQVEGHYALEGGTKATKYDDIIPQLVALEESDRIDGIIILINTLGGDV